MYQEPEFSERAMAKMSEESLRALCECLVINVDDFVRRAAAEAAEEEDSPRGASVSPNPSSGPSLPQVFYCL